MYTETGSLGTGVSPHQGTYPITGAHPLDLSEPWGGCGHSGLRSMVAAPSHCPRSRCLPLLTGAGLGLAEGHVSKLRASGWAPCNSGLPPSLSVAWEPAGDGKRVISLADNHILLWDLQESSSQAMVSNSNHEVSVLCLPD